MWKYRVQSRPHSLPPPLITTPCIADQDRCMSQLFFSLVCHPDCCHLYLPSFSTPDDMFTAELTEKPGRIHEEAGHPIHPCENSCPWRCSMRHLATGSVLIPFPNRGPSETQTQQSGYPRGILELKTSSSRFRRRLDG